VLAVVTPSASGWAYGGGLPLFSLLSAGLIVGLQPASALRTALSHRPIVWVGRVSYEVYLFHWPVFLLVSEDTTALRGVQLSVVRLAITFAISAAVFRAIEQPVRTRRVLARTRPLFTGAATAFATVLVAVTVLVPASRPQHAPPTAVLAATHLAPVATATPSIDAAANGASPAAAPAALQLPPPPPRPTTVAVFGDSVPDWLLRDAASSYVRTDYTIVNGAHEACDGAVNMPVARDRRGKELFAPSECEEWTQSYPAVVADPSHPVDVALLMLGQAPYPDRLFGDQWLGPCQTMGWYTDDVIQRIAYLRQHVSEVVLALPSWSGPHVTFMMPDDHRARMACVRSAMQAMAAADQVPVIDLAALLCPSGPDGECAPYTSQDGVHVNAPDAPFVLNWLLDSLPPLRSQPVSH
jgi:hypothetical protein